MTQEKGQSPHPTQHRPMNWLSTWARGQVGVRVGAGFTCVDNVGNQSGVWWLFGLCGCEVSNGNIGKSIFGKEEEPLCAGAGPPRGGTTTG